jgi:FtsH-binding integral membrane protein
MNMTTSEENVATAYTQDEAGKLIRSFMAKVFGWMTLALVVTALTAYLFAANETLFNLLYDQETGSMSILGWVVMFAPLGFVLLMSFGFQRLPAPVMMLLFVVFAVLMGMSLSFIFYAYTAGSIYVCFGISAGVFGLMAILGATTRMDLTRFGSIMIIGLIGIIAASVINWFIGSETIDYIISIVGVLVFMGLTAYDVQKLKRIGVGTGMGDASVTKLAIYGALSLYLDFINLFLFFLRLFGSRK